MKIQRKLTLTFEVTDPAEYAADQDIAVDAVAADLADRIERNAGDLAQLVMNNWLALDGFVTITATVPGAPQARRTVREATR